MKIVLYEVQSFLSSDLIIYKFPVFGLIFFSPFFSLGDQHEIYRLVIIVSCVCYVKQLCMNVS